MSCDDEAFLLALLNTSPVIDGAVRDVLSVRADGLAWLREHGLASTTGEWKALRAARDDLQAVARGDSSPAVLAGWLDGVSRRPSVVGEGVAWQLDLPAGRTAAALAVLAWDSVRRASPGRLRPCANPECRLFLVDHSKPNSARWCSMAACGNRIKARRHYERERGKAQAEDAR